MRITSVRATAYTYELTRPIGDVHVPAGSPIGSDVAVFVDTDEGLTGVAVGFGHGVADVETFADVLVGADPYPVSGLWEEMARRVFKHGVGGTPKMAMAALDHARWDLRAKVNGVPLWKELGALEGRTRAYASGLDMPLDDDELADFYTHAADLGIRAGKLKVGLDPEGDLRRLTVVRDALAKTGRPPLLMIDANEFWSAKQAIRRVRRMEEEVELVWVEEPVPRRDAVGLRKVSEAITAAVTAGENLDTASDFANLIRAEGADIVQIGMVQGGITPSLRIADLAYAHDLPVTMSNCPGQQMAHLAAALPHHTMMEVIEAGREAVYDVGASIVDGDIVLGDAAGSGVRFDEEALARASVERPSADSLVVAYRRARGAGVHE